MGKHFPNQGRINPKWIIRSGLNSNSFELLCLSSLPASLKNIWSKGTKKIWRYHLFRHVTPKWLVRYELIRDFMPVLVTCKFDVDWIHSNWEKIPFSPVKVNGNAQGRITLYWKVRPGPNSNSSALLYLSSFVTCKFDKDPIKGDWENAEIPFFPLYVNGWCLLPW